VVFALAIYYCEPKGGARRTKSLPQGLQSAGSQKGREAPCPGIGSCPLGIRSYEAATFSKQPASRGPNIDYAQERWAADAVRMRERLLGLGTFELYRGEEVIEVLKEQNRIAGVRTRNVVPLASSANSWPRGQSAMMESTQW
jgi:hypothetical protein